MQITRADELEKVVRRVLYRHRLLKQQLFYNTRQRSIAYARHHFFAMAVEEGFKPWEIQRYCERYGWPVSPGAISYGIKKYKELAENDPLIEKLTKVRSAEKQMINHYEWKGKFKNNQSFDTKLKHYDKVDDIN